MKALDLLFLQISGIDEEEENLDILIDIMVIIPTVPTHASLQTVYTILKKTEHDEFAANTRTYLIALYAQLFPLKIETLL